MNISLQSELKNNKKVLQEIFKFADELKAGTESVVKRIFITGITPMMINDLTSGFNISTDYCLWEKYNELFGFKSEEVKQHIQETSIKEDLIKIRKIVQDGWSTIAKKQIFLYRTGKFY
jgi:hypothetical protein